MTTALVTGANKGIGKEVARGLGERGFTVLVGARDVERGTTAALELAGEGIDARFVRLDVTDEGSVAEAAEWIGAEFGALDVLVNNAGVNGSEELAPTSTGVDAFRRTYETNVFGVVAVTNAMVPLLKRSPAGRIVTVSSNLGSIGQHAAPGSPLPLVYLAYGSSKAAVNSITVQYARELAGTAIKVNACAPGLCDTDLNHYSGPRTAAQGARIAVELATVDGDGPTGGFFSDDGPVPW